ncbi:MAG: hypothetical protein IIB54_15510, partial [Planctomycetes bacterium]|nr:hypothetical protein [Planctomycetota bacterium]
PSQAEVYESVPIHRFPQYRSPLRARWRILRHIDLLHRADVIHVSNTHMLEYFWRMVGCLVSRRKVFLTRHGMSYIHPVPAWEKRRAVRSLDLTAGVVHDGAFIEKWLGVEPDLCPVAARAIRPLVEQMSRGEYPDVIKPQCVSANHAVVFQLEGVEERVEAPSVA